MRKKKKVKKPPVTLKKAKVVVKKLICRIDHSIADTIPEYLCRACHPELEEARKKLPIVTITWKDPRAEASAALRAENKIKETAKRITKLKNSLIRKAALKKVDRTGMRWDTRKAKWVPIIKIGGGQ